MIKGLSAKLFYFVLNEEGKEVTKSRTLNRLATDASDDGINTLASVYENLTGEQYSIVEKVVTHIVQ
ncbi:hypothetical protein JEOAER750_01358 [Jeotgalicoccus aerolatus]|uniref:DUF1659 domain-containing protein n=1 Tax=Jeotgalicoccus aerolatus TaxID=709510 RepID=A0A1G9D4U5_9STAP|nr:DUF1659 domain-containing protein [Jeotgalicoccus aerolatus]MBP1951580.1 hypothetical protein [Jeotgalicoccus aerolatus]NMA80342.1 DUF1659 domain-containing protein [Jeotgalicoccus aerolatus]CAD2076062.1 hypothetical protein JEOAER750_01358 [Jeotgalicoccus aerolatus]SDK58960.1 Protein of unknown function [Jeotgalicoccus aerolatus]GGD96428.1 hypothetical protein GCM10007273_05950 [Jeotgalicoccus aerolatus]